jgi:hypothetical protein
MVNQTLRQSLLLACFAIVAGFFFVASSSLSAANPPRQIPLRVNLLDTGHTVALTQGQQLIVTLPLGRYDDNSWSVVRNSGGAMKLVAGPNEIIGGDTRFGKERRQVFYFQKVSPGTADLVLEAKYWAKPMILKVVDQ